MSPQIQNQHAVVINNVNRDQVIYGNQYGTVVTSEDARRAVRDLRSALADTALDDATSAQARAEVAEINAAVHAPEPDKGKAAARSNGWSSCSPTPDHSPRQARP